jgi:hypothetical protein
MPPHLSHLLQPLNISCFTVLKRSYGKLVKQKMSLGVNHINKEEFIHLYAQARPEALHERNIKSGFSATGLVPYNPERVLSVLHAPIHTPSPQLQLTEATVYTTATPHTVAELDQQVELVKQGIKRRAHSPQSPLDQALSQLIKGCQMAMHNGVLLARQNEQLLVENRRQKQKRAKKRLYIAKGGILSSSEAQELINKRNNTLEEAEKGKPAEARQRAPPKCSLCSSLEHKAPACPGFQRVN